MADEDLDLLGPDRDRAWALRRYLRKVYAKNPASARAVAEQVSLAVDAAHAGDQAAAAACLAAAEDLASRIAGDWQAAAGTRAAAHATQIAAVQAAAQKRKLRKARAAVERATGDPPVTDTVAVAQRGLSGRVRVPAPDPYLVVAADGAWDGGTYGWAYVASDGRWALQGARFGADPSGALLAELAAAGLAARHIRGPAVLVCDSTTALGWVTRWQRGDPALPAVTGDDKRAPRRRDVIADAAGRVRRAGWLPPVHVRGHRGHLLNEAADQLARMARRWRAGQDPARPEEMEHRAAEVTAAFLRSWYGTAPEGINGTPARLLRQPGAST